MDINYLLFLQNMRETLGSGIEIFMGTISAIDVHALIILIPGVLYWCLNKRDGQFVFFTFGLGEFLNGILKLSVCCYRPWIRDPRVIPSQYAIAGATGYSFPSGHSMIAGSVYVSAGWRVRDRYKRIVTAVFFVFAALVLFSRNYLGVHTPQDVIMGMALGIFTIWISTLFMNWIDKNEDKDIVSVAVVLAAVVLALLYFKFKGYPLDYVDGKLLVDPQVMMIDSFVGAGRITGVVLAWLLERRLIRFSTDCSAAEKAVRLIIGIAAVVLVNYLITPAVVSVMAAHFGKFIKGFLPFFTAVFIVPCLFIPVSKLFNK